MNVRTDELTLCSSQQYNSMRVRSSALLFFMNFTYVLCSSSDEEKEERNLEERVLTSASIKKNILLI